jgi:hypothetical protein
MAKCNTSGKQKIKNKKEAEELLFTLKIKRGIRNNNKVEVRYYKCPSCHYLHLTSKPTREVTKMENKKTNENGFSLIELAVAAAIMITLAAVATANYLPLIEKFENKAYELEQNQLNQQAELEAYLNQIGN